LPARFNPAGMNPLAGSRMRANRPDMARRPLE
jgi:hypothetical protein